MSTQRTPLSLALVAVMGLGGTSATAQTPAQAAPSSEQPAYTMPRTSWGDPDLQGVWDYRTITPFERRPELGDRGLLHGRGDRAARRSGREAHGSGARWHGAARIWFTPNT